MVITCNQAPLHIYKQDGHIALYKCVHLDREHSAQRCFFNFPTGRGILIVSNSFWFWLLLLLFFCLFSFVFFLFLFFYRSHFCSVWFKLKTIWFHQFCARINGWLFFPPQSLLPAKSTTKWWRFTGLLYSKRSIGQVQATSAAEIMAPSVEMAWCSVDRTRFTPCTYCREPRNVKRSVFYVWNR